MMEIIAIIIYLLQLIRICKTQQYKNSLLILSLQQFLQMQQNKQEQILKALRDIDRVAEETKVVAVNTNTKAYQNGEQLQRIENKLKGINGQLVKAEDTAKEITSFWYYLKKKVKGVFGIKPNYSNHTENNELSAQKEKEGQTVEEQEHKINDVEKASNEQDQIMDSILSNLGQIKKYGKDLGKQIDKQNKTIERIDPQMDKAINKMGKVNKILKKELNS